jgi:hypothetical protein
MFGWLAYVGILQTLTEFQLFDNAPFAYLTFGDISKQIHISHPFYEIMVGRIISPQLKAS